MKFLGNKAISRDVNTALESWKLLMLDELVKILMNVQRLHYIDFHDK